MAGDIVRHPPRKPGGAAAHCTSSSAGVLFVWLLPSRCSSAAVRGSIFPRRLGGSFEAKWHGARELRVASMEGPPRPQAACREGSLEPAFASIEVPVPPVKMSSASVTSFEKQHLWMFLQALGFEPGPATLACGKIVSHTHLGV